MNSFDAYMISGTALCTIGHWVGGTLLLLLAVISAIAEVKQNRRYKLKED